MKSCQMYRFIPIMLLCVCLFTGGCSQNKDQPSATHNQTPATEAASHTDHTPQVLTPQADGTKTFTTDTAVIDISHTQEGYIMAKYTGFNAKPKLQRPGPHGRFCTSVPFSIIICLGLSLPFWYCLSSV